MLKEEFCFAPPTRQGYYWADYVLKEDVKEEEVEEHG
jgi:hypothetical protein